MKRGLFAIAFMAAAHAAAVSGARVILVDDQRAGTVIESKVAA